MSQEAAPERAVPEQPVSPSVPEQKGARAPKGLLQQMEELMAALSADLTQLDADLQSAADRQSTTDHQSKSRHSHHAPTEHYDHHEPRHF
ncbi:MULTISPECIES: hypothetical protein [unclassified Streptomyces]|uniref:hypothetical protein n=1 Tax=unclassified Streptomyces TaxID=2593676 RepID=UPI0006FEFCD3|nr:MULTISPECIES: hypothetical protein [unclassified Streptomyces]KQX55341.1 hypothetical protein ASD33_31385 [Streptomyces sp. Root1304]KRA95248.1 hypothetical protein ASE09_28865 [Streptomyces sp. Root66D1]